MSTPEFDYSMFITVLSRVREKQGIPIFEDQKAGYQETIQLFQGDIDAILTYRGEHIESLFRKCLDERSKEGLSVTPAYATASACCSIGVGMERKSLRLLESHKLNAIGLLDIAKGFTAVASGVAMMHDYHTRARYWRGVNEENLRVLKTGAELLEKDPTGFASVEHEVEFCKDPLRKTDGSIEPYEVQELIIAGAELAAKTYKRMYPIAEKVLSASH
jgi:hypothetical protein